MMYDNAGHPITCSLNFKFLFQEEAKFDLTSFIPLLSYLGATYFLYVLDGSELIPAPDSSPYNSFCGSGMELNDMLFGFAISRLSNRWLLCFLFSNVLPGIANVFCGH